MRFTIDSHVLALLTQCTSLHSRSLDIKSAYA